MGLGERLQAAPLLYIGTSKEGVYDLSLFFFFNGPLILEKSAST